MLPRPPVVPASPLRRAATAAGSLLVLVSLVGGLPVALALLAGNPLRGLPAPSGIWSALTSPDDGSLFLSVLAVVGWVAWAVFTASVALELFARISKRPAPSIPGLRGPQRLASVLIAAIAALSVTPTVASASAAMVDSPPPAVVLAMPVDPTVAEQSGSERAEVANQDVTHVVERGEGILDLQDRYGVPWQRIAEANYDVPQPDGRALQRGQTRIYPGWQMRIPVPSAAPVETESLIRDSYGTGGGVGVTDPLAVAAAEQATPYEYEVAKGDWLWHVSERYLGDPLRYQEIADLNPEYADRHGDFPDHIEPGWKLRLPEDAVDSGPALHATGTASAAADAATAGGSGEAVGGSGETAGGPGEVAPDDGASAAAPDAGSGETAPGSVGFGARDGIAPGPDGSLAGTDASPATSDTAAPGSATPPAGTAPQAGAAGGQAPSVPERSGAAVSASDPADKFAAAESDLERLAPAALAGAGLLTALVLGAAALHQHRRNQHHRPGFRITSPAARRLEKTLRTAQQPLDTGRLEAALKHLAAGLASREGDLPDLAGAMVDAGSVHLLLASPCPGPPAPWQDHGDRWSLPAGTVLPDSPAPALAPLPTLAAIGSQAGIHLLLDLERLGFLTIHGDADRAMDLLRYLAAELACNTWSDSTEVLLAGVPAAEAGLLYAINPERVRVLPSVADAVTLLRQRVDSARATLRHTGAADALAGRVRAVAGDAWMPQVLLAAAATPADLAAVATLEREIGAGSRCAVAVVRTDASPPRSDQRRVTVTADGVVHVRLPFLHASLSAAGLTVAELEPLAETMRATRDAKQVPVPPAPEPDLWAVGTDAAGSVRGVGQAKVGEPVSMITMQLPVLTSPALLNTDSDRTLDDDLGEWYAEQSERPRIGVLGPATVTATGPAPQARRRLHTELVVYLAQRAGRGAAASDLDAALWPDRWDAPTGRELVISRVRRWLGSRPDGTPWLPDVGADLAYRLADGYLFDWHLFRRLRTRGELRGPDGAEDLYEALRLVRGVPLAGADRPSAPGIRNPYPWLAESDIRPHHLVATIIDTAHQLAERRLAQGDLAGVRWAVQQAWLADPGRSYDLPWQDLLRAEHADGRTDELRSVLAALMEARDAETPEDLAPETYRLISCWPPNVLVPAA